MKRYLNKYDLILIFSVFIISALWIFFVFMNAKSGAFVTIYVDNSLYAVYPLNEPLSVDIEGFNGGHNLLKIENGYACITEASCPDMLCVRQGRINSNSKSIVCLPNRVIVKITDDKSDGEAYDAYSE